MGREFLQLTGRLEALAVFVSWSQDAMKKESTQEGAQQNPRYMQDSSKAALRFGTRKQLRGRWLRTCWANLPVTNILNRQSPCSQDVEDRELTVLSSPTVFFHYVYIYIYMSLWNPLSFASVGGGASRITSTTPHLMHWQLGPQIVKIT